MAEIKNDTISEVKPGGKSNKLAVIAALVVVLLIAGIFLYMKVLVPSQNYRAAEALLEAGKYEEALAAFEQMEGYKDSADKIQQCKTGILDSEYDAALALMNEGKYEEALEAFRALDHKDSKAKAEECKLALIEAKYQKALALMDEKKYEDAAAMFEEAMAEFREHGSEAGKSRAEECEQAITEAKYQQALALMVDGKYVDAAAILEKLDYLDSAEKVEECKAAAPYEMTKIGDIITFGRYEQNAVKEDGVEPLRWRVLDKKDGKLLIITEQVIDRSPFWAIYYKRTYIRGFLDSEFLKFFTQEELDKLVEITVTADKHPDNPGTDQGADTQDRVFLLSVDEADRYFEDNADRVCTATPFAISRGVDVTEDGSCDWWLRTAYKNWANGATIANVAPTGKITTSAHHSRYGLRPACWIQLAS